MTEELFKVEIAPQGGYNVTYGEMLLYFPPRLLFPDGAKADYEPTAVDAAVHAMQYIVGRAPVLPLTLVKAMSRDLQRPVIERWTALVRSGEALQKARPPEPQDDPALGGVTRNDALVFLEFKLKEANTQGREADRQGHPLSGGYNPSVMRKAAEAQQLAQELAKSSETMALMVTKVSLMHSEAEFRAHPAFKQLAADVLAWKAARGR